MSISKDDLLKLSLDLTVMEHIPSIKYRKRLALLGKAMHKVGDSEYFSLYIILNNLNSSLWLTNSTMYAALRNVFNPYWAISVRKIIDNTQQKGYYLFDEPNQSDNQHTHHIPLEIRFPAYPIFSILRSDDHCNILAICSHRDKSQDFAHFYQQYVEAFESFCCQVIEQTQDIIFEFNPQLKICPSLHNPIKTKEMLQNREPIVANKLYDGELEVLYYTALGKTAEEISKITSYQPSTIATYRQRATQKLNAINISHAIYIATSMNLLP